MSVTMSWSAAAGSVVGFVLLQVLLLACLPRLPGGRSNGAQAGPGPAAATAMSPVTMATSSSPEDERTRRADELEEVVVGAWVVRASLVGAGVVGAPDGEAGGDGADDESDHAASQVLEVALGDLDLVALLVGRHHALFGNRKSQSGREGRASNIQRSTSVQEQQSRKHHAQEQSSCSKGEERGR